MTRALAAGVSVQLAQHRDNAALGVMTWATLLALVPDPNREESATALRGDRKLREHAKLRADVQRLLKGSAKGRNVAPYAGYIAAGIRGDLGNAWSVPPICLWSVQPLEVTDEGRTDLPLGSPIIAIDGETQLAAMHMIYDDPDAFDLDETDFTRLPVAIELYWSLTTPEARQIFHDRNIRGVAVAKTLALSMDQRDFGTTLAQQLIKTATVTYTNRETGKEVNGLFETYVNGRKRQLGKLDPEWLTLSALRSLMVTTLLGRAGVESTSGALDEADLPPGVPRDQAINEVTQIVGQFVRLFSQEFADRSAITAPAVLTGIGAALNRTLSWSKEEPQLTRDHVFDLLGQIRWEREGDFWDGVAAKRTGTGALSFAGGAKDSGHKVCDAILSPDSVNGRRIRGRGQLG